jgi:hypothetical protein
MKGWQDKNIIKKHNRLVTACYSLPIKAQRLIAVLASKFDLNGGNYQKHSFELAEIYKLLRVDKQNKKRRRAALHKTLRELHHNLVEITDVSDGRETLLISAWLESSTIEWDRGVVTLRGAENLKPFFTQLRKHFTRYTLKDILNLTTAHAFRFLEICKNYEPRPDYYDGVIDGRYVNERIYTVEKLRSLLKIPAGKFLKYSNFKKKIVEVSQREINDKTSAYFHFEVYKDTKDRRRAIGFKLLIFGPHITTRPLESENPDLTPPSPEETTLRLRMRKLGVSSRFQDIVFSDIFDEKRIKLSLDAVEEWQKNLNKKRQDLKNPARALELALLENWFSKKEETRRLEEQRSLDRLENQRAQHEINDGLTRHAKQRQTDEARMLEENHQQAMAESLERLKEEEAAYLSADDKTAYIFELAREQFQSVWNFEDEQEELFKIMLDEKIAQGLNFAEIKSCLVIEVFVLLLPKKVIL